MDTNTWKIEKDLCRCCHTEGSFKNLAEPCTEMGEEEVYCDMLRDSFDIDLTPVPGNLCAPTYTICEACINRLRDATIFKKQVLVCEKKFREMYSKNVIIAAAPPFLFDVKQEPDPADDYMKYDMMGMDDGDDSADDKDSLDIKCDESDQSDDEDDYKLSILEEASKKKSKLKITQKKPKQSKQKKPPKKEKMNKEKSVDVGDKTDGDDVKPKKKGNTKYYTKHEESYTCNICHKQFATQPLVSQHYRFVHLKQRPKMRKCPHCDIKYPGHLRAYHLEDSHGIPAPKCGICDKKFRYPSALERHQKKAHMGERTITCDVCQKKFFDSLSLRIHKATHGEKKYECAVCSKRFRWENNLKDHERIHSGDRRFACPVCDISFVQRSTMKQHVGRRHPGIVV